MARKPREQWTPAYRRRIERAEAAGKTRQQARGHKEREHVERAEKERKKYGETRDHLNRVRHWYDAHFNQYNNKDAPNRDELVAFVRLFGWKWFEKYRDTWNAARREYLRQLRAGTYATKGLGYLQTLTDMAGIVPPGDISWLYYH